MYMMNRPPGLWSGFCIMHLNWLAKKTKSADAIRRFCTMDGKENVIWQLTYWQFLVQPMMTNSPKWYHWSVMANKIQIMAVCLMTIYTCGFRMTVNRFNQSRMSFLCKTVLYFIAIYLHKKICTSGIYTHIRTSCSTCFSLGMYF